MSCTTLTAMALLFIKSCCCCCAAPVCGEHLKLVEQVIVSVGCLSCCSDCSVVTSFETWMRYLCSDGADIVNFTTIVAFGISNCSTML